jgi:hypothetical protein
MGERWDIGVGYLPRALVISLASLSKRHCGQHERQIVGGGGGGGGAGLKTVFVSVCGNLQHIRQNIRFLKFFCFLARAL